MWNSKHWPLMVQFLLEKALIWKSNIHFSMKKWHISILFCFHSSWIVFKWCSLFSTADISMWKLNSWVKHTKFSIVTGVPSNSSQLNLWNLHCAWYPQVKFQNCWLIIWKTYLYIKFLATWIWSSFPLFVEG